MELIEEERCFKAMMMPSANFIQFITAASAGCLAFPFLSINLSRSLSLRIFYCLPWSGTISIHLLLSSFVSATAVFRCLPLSPFVCRFLLCLPLSSFVYHFLPLSATVSLCLPIPSFVCHCLSLSATVSLCLPLYPFVCNFLSLSMTVSLCFPLLPCVCHCLPLSATFCLCLPLSSSVFHYLPLSATFFLCLPLFPLVCHFLPLFATLSVYNHVWPVRLSWFHKRLACRNSIDMVTNTTGIPQVL